jgi:Tfp pilus assembly protein FimT
MTVLESCAAAIVVTTAMAVSLPSLNRTMDAYRLRSAASVVAAHLHGARIAAITRNTDCRVTVTSGGSYRMECNEDGWRVVEDFVSPKGITVEANTRPEFHRRGNVVPTATFTLRNESGGVRRVIVNVNGRVRIQ